jgi:hypothetical protein
MNFGALPEDLMRHVLRFLHVPDRLRLVRCSSGLQYTGDQPQCWPEPIELDMQQHPNGTVHYHLRPAMVFSIQKPTTLAASATAAAAGATAAPDAGAADAGAAGAGAGAADAGSAGAGAAAEGAPESTRWLIMADYLDAADRLNQLTDNIEGLDLTPIQYKSIRRGHFPWSEQDFDDMNVPSVGKCVGPNALRGIRMRNAPVSLRLQPQRAIDGASAKLRESFLKRCLEVLSRFRAQLLRLAVDPSHKHQVVQSFLKDEGMLNRDAAQLAAARADPWGEGPFSAEQYLVIFYSLCQLPGGLPRLQALSLRQMGRLNDKTTTALVRLLQLRLRQTLVQIDLTACCFTPDNIASGREQLGRALAQCTRLTTIVGAHSPDMPEVVLAALEYQANATAAAAATSITRVDVTGVRLSLEALQRLGDVAHRLQAIRISDRQGRGSAMAAVFPIDRSLRIQHQEELSSMLFRAIRHPQSRLAIVCVDYNSVVPCAMVRALADQLQILYGRRGLPSLLGEDYPPWWNGRRLDYAYNGIFYSLEEEEQGPNDAHSDADADSDDDSAGEEDVESDEEDAAEEDAAEEDAAEENAAEEDAAEEDAAEEDAAEEDAAEEDAAASVGEKRKLESAVNDHSKKPKHSSSPHSDDID